MEDGEKKVSVSALKAIKDRRSIRKFKSEPISEMDLHTILEAGIAAPSSKNRQPWHFTVVRGEAKEELTLRWSCWSPMNGAKALTLRIICPWMNGWQKSVM